MRIFALFSAPIFLFAQANTPLENEYVRVVLATDAPVLQPGKPHEHKQNRVMIYLDSGDIRIQHADGKIENQHWTPGDVAWSPAGGVHTSQNVSARTIRIVEIELKNEGKKSTASGPPDRTRAVIDNAQVRVYKGSTPPEGRNFVAVNIKSAEVVWDKLPGGPGPFVITEVK